MSKETNFYENDGKTIKITYSNYGKDKRNLSELMDWLGEVATITQGNELYQFACLDDCGNIFDFTNEDEVRLAKNGSVELSYTGETIEDYRRSDEDFYKWFWNVK